MDELYNNINKNLDDITSTPISKKKFKLKKEKSRIVTLYSKPETNHIKLTNSDINKIKNKFFGKELIKFRKKMYKHFKSENLDLLNQNLKTLKVKIKYIAPEILLLKFAGGKYYIKKNKIKLINFFIKDVINHELFHLSTSYYNEKLELGFCGFQQIDYLKKETIGYGLNEGYTELLTDRYFNKRVTRMTYSYKICRFFASKLEQIVEKERMESLYMNADLGGLCQYLLNFDDGSNIVTFVVLLDKLLKKGSTFNTNKQEKYYKIVELYLVKWYINKKKQELDKNIIDINTFDKQIKNYIDSLSCKDLYIENYIKKEYCLK